MASPARPASPRARRLRVGPERVADPGVHLIAFLDDVLVTCPRCGAVAHVRCPAPWWEHAPRLTCGGCAYVREGWPARNGKPGRPVLRYGGPTDPYYDLPLALRTTVRGRELWAVNPRHLALLADWIGARHRLRYSPPVRLPPRKTMLAMLPTWMRRAGLRDEVLAALAALAARADDR